MDRPHHQTSVSVLSQTIIIMILFCWSDSGSSEITYARWDMAPVIFYGKGTDLFSEVPYHSELNVSSSSTALRGSSHFTSMANTMFKKL